MASWVASGKTGSKTNLWHYHYSLYSYNIYSLD